MKPLDPPLHTALKARRWLRREWRFSDFHGILLWAGLVGFSAALVTAAFRQAIAFLTASFTGKSGYFVEVAMALPPWQRVLIPTLGSLIAGLILQFGSRLLPKRPVSDYMEAVAVGDGFLSIRATLVKCTSSLFTIASGGSIGREGAMVQLSALAGSILGRLLNFPRTSRRLLVACGAAAGIAAVYNAPLSAAVFVCEILLGSVELEQVGPLIVASVIANATSHNLLGYEPVFQAPVVSLQSSQELLFYLVLGLAAGHLGPAFIWLLEMQRQMFLRLTSNLTVRLTLGGLVVGLVSVLNPMVWGNGFEVISSILQHQWTTLALGSILLAKLFATSAMVGSGAVGGVFTPTLFCGAVLGAFAGGVAEHIAPNWVGPAEAYALVGMGAFLAATTHAPLTSVLMVFEMTRQYDIVLPLMIASIAAEYTAKSYGRSIYAEAQQVRARPDFELKDLLRRPEVVVTPSADLAVLRQLFSHTPYNSLQVVDAEGKWLGVIGRKQLATALPDQLAGQLVSSSSRFLSLAMTAEQAYQTATEIPSETLPVVDEAGIYQGTLSKSSFMRALQRRIRG
jgi:CIC family chloride channel protein